MKQTIKEFFAKCGLRRDKTPPNDPEEARYERIYQMELEWLKREPENAAHCFAYDTHEQILQDEDDERNNVGDSRERYARAERIEAWGDLFNPPSRPLPEMDGPDLDRE
jgi:hypothetical protein